MTKVRQSSPHKRPEILIAEDSLTQATQLEHLLKNNHYKVSVAQNGKQAMDKLSKHKPSLVISDILMPEINGYELCKKIKSNKDTQDIPVILLTMLSDPEEIIEGLSCGADSFITKPYNEKHLLSNIGKILSIENGDDYQKVPFGVQILFNGEIRTIQAEQQNVIRLMLDIYEGAIHQNEKLVQTREELRLLNEQLESAVGQRTSDLREEMNLNNQIAERLKESEEKFRKIFEDQVAVKFLIDPNTGEIIDSNKAATNFYGWSREEFKEMKMEKIDTLTFKEFKKEMADTVSQKRTHFEFRHRLKDGSIRDVEVFNSKIKIRNKDVLHLIVYDITDRKKAEETIRIMASFPSENPDPILRVDRNGKLLFANEASYKLLTWKLKLGEKVHSSLLNTVINTIKEGNAKEIDTDHDQRIYSVKIVPVAEESYANIYCRDVTIIKQVIKEIHDLNAQLEQRVVDRTFQLEAANKELEAFSYSVSHDLRAPLRAVDGFSKFILEDYRDKLDSEGTRLLNLIRSNTQKMDQLITDLLALSRVNRNELKIATINMSQMAISVYDETVQDDIKNNIRFTVDQLPEADADPAYIKQVWINLISNAIKFSSKKKNPEIIIGGKSENNNNTYFIKDNGAGFNKEYVHKLFGVFHRLHTSDDFEGTGIGLAIVQRIISRHGGRVWAEGEERKGATFRFSLPVKK